MDIEYIEEKLKEHGELHIVVEEHEAVMADPSEDYIGIRVGNTSFDYDSDVIEIEDGTETHYLEAERVVYIYGPTSFPD